MNVVPWRTVTALDDRIDHARDRLQRTTELDPAFEHRVRALIELVKKRDQAVTDHGAGRPPAA